MAKKQWALDQGSGELLLRTAVAGRAAKMGHRLTIAMRRWEATVGYTGSRPVALDLTVEADGLEVLRGEGGVKPISGPEKAIARQNALRSLGADKHPRIEFHADTITATDDGYDVAGALTIHGVTVPRTLHVDVAQDAAGAHYTCAETVTQTDFGIKPFSLMVGSLRVADDVEVTFSATGP